MKKVLLGLVSALFLCVGSFAADAPASPAPDQAATEAVKSLEEMIARGEVGWWKSQADPSIQFVNKYSGLGGDAVAALTLNQAEQLWPSWKTVGNGLERFGIACSVYNCLKSASEGRYDAATLNALKDFLKYRLSKMGDALATSAAGVGLIDFALNSFGEAAMQQITDDYWDVYYQYQVQRHPRLSDYVRLITEGDGTRRGFEAVVASLDSFWDDPATDGIRGFAALKTQDPDYRATFRSRYLKENLLPFLQSWAERERDKAEVAAWVALRRLTEELQNTVVTVDFALLEKGLNAPPAGATLDVAVEFYHPQNEIRVLAKAPIAERNRLQFPLKAALGANRELPRSLKIRLYRPTDTEPPHSYGTNIFEVAWINPAGAWRREAKPGQLTYVAKAPLLTSVWSEFPITMTGDGADQISSITFRPLPVGTAADLREIARAPSGNNAYLKNGQGKMRLEHGLYLVDCQNELFVFTHGPVKITGPESLTIPVRRAVEQSLAAPNPETYRASMAQATAAVRQRQGAQREAIASASQTLQDYWLGTYTAINGYLATARALQDKLNAELRAPQLTVEQQRAIRDRYQPRITAAEQARDATERAMWDTTREEEKLTTDVTNEASERYNTIGTELRTADDELGQTLNDIRQKLWPVANEFQQLANRVTSGSLQVMAAASLDDELAQMRESLKKVETGLPGLLQAGDRLAPLQTRYNDVVATVREVEASEGYTIHSNPADRDGEIGTLTLQIDAIRNSGFLERARTMLQKAERVVERRREQARRMAAFRQELEALAQQLPLPDEAVWRERTAQLRAKIEPLFAAAVSIEGEDDTPAFRDAQTECARFFQEQSAVCGDLLEGAAKTATAYSRFQEKFEEFRRQQLWREVGPDFWATMDQLAWTKVRARQAATEPALTLARDVDRWLHAGATRAARAQRLATVRSELDPQQPARDPGGQVERLNRIDAMLGELPVQLVANERKAWDAARTQLVRSGQFDIWLRNQPKPYVQFSAMNDKPLELGCYWPETADRSTPQTQQGLSVSVALKNVTDDSMYVLQESTDGGKTWRTLNYYGGQWRSYLQWQEQGRRFRALLPGGERTLDLPAFPHYVPPHA